MQNSRLRKELKSSFSPSTPCWNGVCAGASRHGSRPARLGALFMSPEAGPVVPNGGGDWTQVTRLISGLVSSWKLCCEAGPVGYLARYFNEA